MNINCNIFCVMLDNEINFIIEFEKFIKFLNL